MPDPILTEQFGLFWVLEAPIEVVTFNYRVAVPQGIITDFASVPRLFWPVFPPSDPDYSAAAVGHDWCYANRFYTRREADAFLYEAARANGTGRVRAWLIWAGVRLGGMSAYATGPARQIENRRRFEALQTPTG
jgi:hypothetical protein